MHPQYNIPHHPVAPPRTLPFTIKSALLTAFVSIALIPVAILLPLFVGDYLDWGFVTQAGLMDENLGMVLVVTQILGLAVTVFIIQSRLVKFNLPWSTIGLNKFRGLHATLYIVVFFAIMLYLIIYLALFVIIISALLGIDPPDANLGVTNASYAVDLLDSMGGFWPAFILTVILAPILEEIIFRGMLFPAIRARYGVAAGVAISGLLFAIAHLDPIRIIVLTPMGIYLAIMYQKTRSIYPGIILHALWNFMVIMIAQAQLTG